MSRSIGSLAVMAMLLAHGACGETKPDAEPFQTRLDGSKPLNSLTPDERAVRCADLTRGVEALGRNPRLVGAACRLRGADAADGAGGPAEARQACEDEVSSCTAELSTKQVVSNCSEHPDPCTATIDELNACLNADVEVFAALGFGAPDCAHLDAKFDAAMFNAALDNASQACAPLHSKCPVLP